MKRCEDLNSCNLVITCSTYNQLYYVNQILKPKNDRLNLLIQSKQNSKYIKLKQAHNIEYKMLKVSCKEITFNEKETIKSLVLQNQYDSNMIFKIKVNTIQTISIQPNRGFIRKKSKVSFIIKSLKQDIFQTKVLFTYALIDQKNGDFSQQWEQIKKKQNPSFHNQIIVVKRIELLKQTQGFLNAKRSKSPLMKFGTPNKLPFAENKQKQQSPLFKNRTKKASFINSTDKVKLKEEALQEEYIDWENQQGRVFYTSQQMQQVIDSKDEIEKAFSKEKIKNIKIAQQLSITQAKLKEATQDKMHIQVHKSIGIVCEDYHTTFTHLLIIALICFVFGFSLGKIEAETV